MSLEKDSEQYLYEPSTVDIKLYLRATNIETRHQIIHIVPIFNPDINTDVLLVTSPKLSRIDYMAYMYLFSLLELSVQAWDVERYKGLCVFPDQGINGVQPTLPQRGGEKYADWVGHCKYLVLPCIPGSLSPSLLHISHIKAHYISRANNAIFIIGVKSHDTKVQNLLFDYRSQPDFTFQDGEWTKHHWFSKNITPKNVFKNAHYIRKKKQTTALYRVVAHINIMPMCCKKFSYGTLDGYRCIVPKTGHFFVLDCDISKGFLQDLQAIDVHKLTKKEKPRKIKESPKHKSSEDEDFEDFVEPEIQVYKSASVNIRSHFVNILVGLLDCLPVAKRISLLARPRVEKALSVVMPALPDDKAFDLTEAAVPQLHDIKKDKIKPTVEHEVISVQKKSSKKEQKLDFADEEDKGIFFYGQVPEEIKGDVEENPDPLIGPGSMLTEKNDGDLSKGFVYGEAPVELGGGNSESVTPVWQEDISSDQKETSPTTEEGKHSKDKDRKGSFQMGLEVYRGIELPADRHALKFQLLPKKKGGKKQTLNYKFTDFVFSSLFSSIHEELHDDRMPKYSEHNSATRIFKLLHNPTAIEPNAERPTKNYNNDVPLFTAAIQKVLDQSYWSSVCGCCSTIGRKRQILAKVARKILSLNNSNKMDFEKRKILTSNDPLLQFISKEITLKNMARDETLSNIDLQGEDIVKLRAEQLSNGHT